MPAKGARCLTWDCPRKSRGRGGHGKRVARCGPGPRSPGGCAGAVREGVRGRTRDGCRRGVCSVTGRGREGARRRLVAAAGRPPGRGRPEPGEGCASTPDGRSEDPPAGAGGRRRGSRGKAPQGVHAAAARPAGGGAVSSTASPAANPAVRAGPGGHERDGPSTAISPRPGPAPCAAGPRPRAGPGLRSSIKIRRAGGRGGGRARVLRGPSPSPTAIRCSKRGGKPGPLSTTDALTGWTFTRSIRRRRRQGTSSRPPAPPWTRSRHRVPGTGPRRRVGIHRPRRGAAGREPGASTLPPARAPTGRTTRPPSRPEKQPRGAPLRLPATATDADAEHRVPGRLWEPARHPSQLPRPPPASPSGGAPAGPAGASTCGLAPHTPRPAAKHRRPGRRPEGRIDRLPQPAQPRRHHPPHHRAPGRPRPPGQGQDRPAPAPPGPPASCPTSARASGSGEPPGRPRSRGQFHVRHRRSFAGTLT